MTTQQIEITDVVPQAAAVVRGRVPVEMIPAFLGDAFSEVMRVVDDQRRSPAGPPFARYRPRSDGFDVEAGFPVDAAVTRSGRVLPAELPGGPTASALHQGEYSTVAETYEAVTGWLAANGYVPAGPPWESYLDEPSVAEPRTLVSFPCRRT
jgi:effector-binding domain-containing protein